MVVKHAAAAIGDFHQTHRTAAFGAANGWFGWHFRNCLSGQQVAPTKVEPDQHPHPGEFQLAVLAGEAVVAQLLKVVRQRVL